MEESSGMPKESEVFWDVGKMGRGVLSVVVGIKHTKVRKQLKKWFGAASITYWNVRRCIAEEWVIRQNGRKYLGKIKKLVKGVQSS